MKFIADLHIHSHFSIATSSALIPEMLELWGAKKGISVVGTGDAVHPGWISELKEKLEFCSGNGLYQLKRKYRVPEKEDFKSPVYFLLTSEISCIYKKDGRVRKVHNLIGAPDIKSMEKIQKALSKIGNIQSDGRPILGLDSRDLLEIVLSSSPQSFLIPAHIWTPWFSVLGSKSGFDRIEDCYGDLAPEIFAVETGLSSDPAMNWQCSFLDKYRLISNSDAHSPDKLGREATLFDTELSYTGILNALKDPKAKGFGGTIEYFPEEGKYHLDGHRKCGIKWEPKVTKKNKGICSVCGKPVTVGVLSRVHELSDMDYGRTPSRSVPYYSLTPLVNILSEICKTGPASKKVTHMYEQLIRQFSSEFAILIDIPTKDLQIFNVSLSEAVKRLRRKEITVESGYDGVFGSVQVLCK